jgi:hypothetical protein
MIVGIGALYISLLSVVMPCGELKLANVNANLFFDTYGVYRLVLPAILDKPIDEKRN